MVAVSGDLTDEPAELFGAWTPVDRVLSVGADAERLAQVFLMDV